MAIQRVNEEYDGSDGDNGSSGRNGHAQRRDKVDIVGETEGTIDKGEEQAPKISAHTGGCAGSEGASVVV